MGDPETHLLLANRRRYLTRIALSHLSACRVLRRGRLLGRKTDPTVWRNAGEHALVAGAFAQLVAEQLRLPSNRVQLVTTAALLHDWFKQEEVRARRAAGPGASLAHVVAAVKEEDQRQLQALGYSAELVQLTDANLPKDVNGPQTDEERILWYVDAMLNDTDPIPIDERFDALENHPTRGTANRAFSASYTFVLAGRSLNLYDLQRHLGQVVGTELARRIGYTGPIRALPLHLRDLFWHRVAEEPL